MQSGFDFGPAPTAKPKGKPGRAPRPKPDEAALREAYRRSELAQAPLVTPAQPQAPLRPVEAPKPDTTPALVIPTETPAESLARWRVELAEYLEPENADLARLLKVSRAFLDSPWLTKAQELGWPELDIWGVIDGPTVAQKCRVDCHGLVPSLAWAHWPVKLAELHADRAVMRTQNGELTHRRRTDLAGQMKVWWKVSK